MSTSITLMVPYAHLADKLPGPEFKVYNLPPALLTAPYFVEQCHEPAWDSNQIIVLQETVVDPFDVYEHWLLTGELLLSDETGQSQAKAGFEKLLSCCNLACILGDKTFLDALVTHLISTLRLANSFQSHFIHLLTQDRIEQIIAEAGVYSGFFKLIAHAYARFSTVDEVRVLAFSTYNVYFKGQVMQSMASMRARQHMDGNEGSDFVVAACV